MEDLRIYAANGMALTFSFMENVDPILKTIVLILTIIYTSIRIYKQLKK